MSSRKLKSSLGDSIIYINSEISLGKTEIILLGKKSNVNLNIKQNQQKNAPNKSKKKKNLTLPTKKGVKWEYNMF